MAKLPPLSEEDRENLVAYLDGELSSKAARVLEARLNLDAEARAEAEALRRTWQMLDYLPRPEPTATFSSRTLERVSGLQTVVTPTTDRSWPHWALKAGWAAALLLACALGFTGVSRLSGSKPSPPDVAPPIHIDTLLPLDLTLLDTTHLPY